MNLAETQRLFWWLLAAPKGAADGLESLPEAQRDAARAMVRPSSSLSSVERLDIYASMYFYRILDALRQDFPKLATALGEEVFHNLITDYLLVHPSRHYSLRRVGERLPAFIAKHDVRRSTPFAADLGALEWALVDSFEAADHDVLTTEALAQVPASRWGDLILEASPSLRLLDLQFPVDSVWSAVAEDEAAPLVREERTRIRVWRRDLQVFHLAIDESEHTALRAISDGVCFAEVCERVSGVTGDDPAETVVAGIRRWLGCGLLAGFRLAG